MGLIDGVLDTRSSWIGRHEVVEVSYDAARVGYSTLLETAIEEGCASRVWTTDERAHRTARARLGDRAEELTGTPRPAKASDQLYYLRQSPLRHVPLTPLQARRVNGRLGQGGADAGAVERLMSERQRSLARRIERALEKDPSAFDGLSRPDDRAPLRAYARELDLRLTAAGV